MWKFRELTEGELERHPHESEFFNVGNIDKADALVREIIQNSLDAKLPGQPSVRLRFAFGRHGKDVNDNHYRMLIPHVESCNLLPHYYASLEDIPFLTIEDFGTTGLDGPISREEFKDGEGGNYYNFWWCEGKSQKAGQKAGRWGLGKTAFHVASDLRSFWGLTVRQADSRKLLLGKSLLTTHPLDGAVYDYYGYFAEEGYHPTENPTSLQVFCEKFSLARGHEPGLSIVIPLPSPDMDSREIIRSVIIHYFFPIMKGMLSVDVIDGISTVTLNASTLRRIAHDQDWANSDWQGRPVDSLMEFLEDTVTMPEERMITLQMPSGSPKIIEAMFGNQLNELQDRFAENQLVCVKVPVRIQPRQNPPVDSYFEVYIKKDDTLDRPDEFYVRAGITISEIKKLGNRRVRALLSAQDEAVCTFLGDCESPAHTEWKEKTERFQETYNSAISTLRFIKSSMSDIVKILDQPPPGPEHDLLMDVFFIQDPIEPEEPDVPPPPREIEGTKPQVFMAFWVPGGFRVALATEKVDLPIQAIIKVAYDMRRGNPFSNYSPMDFKLTDDNIGIVIKGGNIEEIGQNQIKVTASQYDFELQVTGFDQHRDLIVDVKGV